ncbi:ThiF family adenylyltransferase [Geodermatophilus sp. DSM 44513]|uniref:ThiF family adenylyltransferase n=1 Tax=Geodermatophilus sp. DSM 44513 TaxID=1528104 RepID=UPI0012713A5E|nr:ThiF family adenylyltransferase [Geodermatophilus sp. DSM 44513]WNV74444.1 ThiF family adenylyltransferase [Geodermatophilus sp. DSM 44513]
MTRRSLVIVPAEAADKIRASAGAWGTLGMVRAPSDDLFVITAYQAGKSGAVLPVRTASGQERHRRVEEGAYEASWHRADAVTHWAHYSLSARPDHCMPLEQFRRLIPTAPHPHNDAVLVLTHAPGVTDNPDLDRLPEFAAWRVTREGAEPFDLAVEPRAYGLGQLVGHWPVEALSARAVLVVGVGSIGGEVASSLAGYGVGQLDLLDPDRLLWHNTVRHVLGEGDIGRFKTDALRDMLTTRWPSLDARSHVKDVVRDADHVRLLLQEVDAVVCAADGIAPRRVVSHLARRAGRDAILTSVLEDGAFGEVLRLRRAPDEGCLLCRRADLYGTGRMDPERALERGYGDGDPHRPMTAVGPDLHLMGDLAAKVTVASLLQRQGHNEQRLPGEQAIVALRPQPGFEAPFDLGRAGQVQWHPATPPRPDCITCSTP